MRVVGPGAALGVLGGGQLGRMFTIAARRMGYRVNTYSPDEDTPAGQVADIEVTASYEDLDALRAFARSVDVVTFEFENVPIEAIDAVEALTPVRPSGIALHTTRQRAREKVFLADRGFPTAPFARAATLDELWNAVATIGTPAVVKTAAFGYDGKGQHSVTTPADVDHIWTSIGHQEAVVEKRISLQAEISVIGARGLDGEMALYPVFENRHHHHILDVTTAPASLPREISRRAAEITRAILEELQYVGVLCVEFFLSTDGDLLVNEIAPRPHNSGHLTFDAAVTSQFEQQVRAITGLPLGSTDLLRPSAMANLLGELWLGGEPNWSAASRFTDVKLHLYGKAHPRPGRKMGHLTCMARTVQDAQDRVVAARDALLI
jgi:5-(carboxyamino)imidazole ribonucleotide synthase